MDVMIASEIDRRAWAVEQGVKVATAFPGNKIEPGVHGQFVVTDPGTFTMRLADQFLTYIHKPLVEADARLLAALRGYDGSQDAGNLIGLAADALERK